MMRYFAKPNEWYDPFFEVELVDDYRPDNWNAGLFRGLRNGKVDEEICPFEEFEAVDELTGSS
jgi:hypothetical protein